MTNLLFLIGAITICYAIYLHVRPTHWQKMFAEKGLTFSDILLEAKIEYHLFRSESARKVGKYGVHTSHYQTANILICKRKGIAVKALAAFHQKGNPYDARRNDP